MRFLKTQPDPVFMFAASALAVPRVLADLLEGRPVGPAHRVRDEARLEGDALRVRVGAPRRGIRPLCRGEVLCGLPEDRPQRVATGREVTVAAVAAAVGLLHGETEQAAEVLVDVAV